MTILRQFCLILITATVISSLSLGHSKSNNKLDDDYCFSTDTEQSQLKRFSTKQAYQLVKNLNTDDTAHVVPGTFFFYYYNFFYLFNKCNSQIAFLLNSGFSVAMEQDFQVVNQWLKWLH